MVNVGLLIEQKLNELNVSKSEFARRLGIANQNVNKMILARSSIDTDKLYKVGEVLGYNFFVDLANDGSNNAVTVQSGTAIANGDHSAAAVNGNATVNSTDTAAVLEERVRSLEAQARQKDLLLEEKERLIQVLLKSRE